MKFLNPGLKLLFTGLFLFLHISCQPAQNKYAENRFVSFVADPETTDIQFYWKDDAGKPFMLLQNLKTYLEGKGKKLRFAMNGGMYMENTTPLGLYIAHGKTVRPLNTPTAFFTSPIPARLTLPKPENSRQLRKLNLLPNPAPCCS